LKLFFSFSPGAACFFVKHVQTGMCIRDTGIVQAGGPSWGNLTLVELSNNCLDPVAQFRFLDNSAMFNSERKGCFEGTARGGIGYSLSMLYMLFATNPIFNCRNNQAITQTSWGGLSVFEIPSGNWHCAISGKDGRLATNQGTYIGLTANCDDAEDKRFNFGEFALVHFFSV
jgi:hypothetical protein